MIIALSSMAFSGFFARVLRGGTYLTVMVLGKPSQGASMLGASEECGNRFSRSCSSSPMRLVSLTRLLHFVDGSVIRVHQHAAGASGSDADSEALGYSTRWV